MALSLLAGTGAASAQTTTALFFDSQPGDYIGQGEQRTHTPPDATFTVTRNHRNGVSLRVMSAGSFSFWWDMDFSAAWNAPLAVGTYEGAQDYPFSPVNGISFGGSGRGCGGSGRFVVLEVAYLPDGTVQRFAADFEQHCSDAVPALFGAIRFNSTISNLTPFGGQYPLYKLTIASSANGHVGGGGLDCGSGGSICDVTFGTASTVALTATPDAGYVFAGWATACIGAATTSVHVNGPKVCSAQFQPLVSAAPRTLLYWDSEPGDYIGAGKDDVYSPLNSIWTVTPYEDGRTVSIRVEGAINYWTLEFSAPQGQVLAPGYYGNAWRYPFATFNGLSVSGSGRGCNELTGRFVILELSISPSGTVERFAADFEQHCSDAVPALFGAVRYNATVDEVVPFGGAYPNYSLTVPLPMHGRVTGEGLDCGGGAATCQVSLAAAAIRTLTATPDSGYVFAGWSGDCLGSATTSVHVNGPKACVPAFEPLVSAAPRTLFSWESQPGDYIGGGGSGVYSTLNSRWIVSSPASNRVSVTIVEQDGSWRLDFSAPVGVPLLPGIYNAAHRQPFTSFNGLSVTSPGRGCNQLTGRFVILEIALGPNGTVDRFAADFEQHCEDAVPALFGAVRYNATVDDVVPFGGAFPVYSLAITPPSHGRVTGGGLDCGSGPTCHVSFGAASTVTVTATPDPGYVFAGWTTDCRGGPTTSVHVNGPKVCTAVFESLVSAAPRTLLYWDSQPGDYIGAGRSVVYAPANSRWTVTSDANNRVSLAIEDPVDSWRIEFSTPSGVPMAPGYYTAARRYPFTPFNGLSVSGSGRGCNQLTGRFVVLEVAFGPTGTLERFAADFEQHCEDAVPALFGAVRYNATVDEVLPFAGAYPQFTLAVAQPLHGRVTAAGVDCGGSGAACQVTLGAAASRALTAVPDFGYTFMGWTDDCSGGPSTMLHVNGPKRCGARFEPTAATAPRTLLHWDSQPGHYIGQGRGERLFSGNSRWTPRQSSGPVAEFYVESVGPTFSSYWTVGFVPPTGDVLQAGRRYLATTTSTSPSPTSAAFYVYGNGRFCAGGEFTVREVALTSSAVLKFAVDFILNCGSATGPLLTGSLQYNSTIDVPPSTLTLDPASLRFSSVHNGAAVLLQPAPQVVRLSLSRADVGWTIVASQPWITVTPSSGTGPATLTVAPNLLGGHPGSGTATGTVTVTLTDGTGTARAVALTVTLYLSGTTSPPFGIVDTPLENSTGVTGAIPVTGWVLDDVEVADMNICRAGVAGEVVPFDARCGGASQIFVGNGIFIEGARPDVRTAYPTHPRSDAAGWGFMLLTNNLPNQGNGTYFLSMYARDREGYVRLLGTRTITCDNAHATIPFGAIDTPVQGGTISGASYVNYGWALTQNPKMIPFDGSTLMVYIDGAPVGNPSYNHYRSDIATTFPGLANSNGAVGLRAIDTTTLTDGLHTITWTAADSAGGAAGIGSRFFRVANGSAALAAATSIDAAAAAMSDAAVSSVPLDTSPLVARRGWALDRSWTRYGPTSAGRVVIRGEEIDRFELDLGGESGDTQTGFLRAGDRLGALPIGSRLDGQRGTFTWAPGPGFVGNYDFVFVRMSRGRPIARRDVRIVLHAKGSGRVGTQVVIDSPRSQQDIAQPFALAGWAADLDASSGSGIDVLHVWAYPLAGGPPVFLGTTVRAPRPDVAAIHGEQFRDSGFGLVVQGLTPGHYDLAVFPWSTARGDFLPAQVVRVTVR